MIITINTHPPFLAAGCYWLAVIIAQMGRPSASAGERDLPRPLVVDEEGPIAMEFR